MRKEGTAASRSLICDATPGMGEGVTTLSVCVKLIVPEDPGHRRLTDQTDPNLSKRSGRSLLRQCTSEMLSGRMFMTGSRKDAAAPAWRPACPLEERGSSLRPGERAALGRRDREPGPVTDALHRLREKTSGLWGGVTL